MCVCVGGKVVNVCVHDVCESVWECVCRGGGCVSAYVC